MCAGAIVWSQLKHVTYGYGIFDALAQGRRRIGISCKEIFDRANTGILVRENLLSAECAVLYDVRVRNEIKKLRGASDEQLAGYDEDSKRKRLEWYSTNKPSLSEAAPIEMAYELLRMKLDIDSTEAPIVEKDARRIGFNASVDAAD